MENSKPLRCKASKTKISELKPPDKNAENFGFRRFFVAKTLKMVWVKMWANRLTHTVTHTRLCRLLPAHALWVRGNA